jgi:PEP-CTERM motif
MHTSNLFAHKVLLGLGLTVALSAVVSATPILGLPTCASRTSYGSIGAGCQIGDKQFTNFNVGAVGTIPSNWDMTFEVLTTGTFRLDFAQGGSGSLLQFPAGPWTVSYNVQVDTNMAPNNYITEVGISINPGSFGEGNVQKTVTDLTPGNEGFVLGVGIANTLGSNPAEFLLKPASQWIRVVEVVTLTKAGSALSSFTDGFRQSTIPEPATYGMMGLGLAALGLVSRRKKT